MGRERQRAGEHMLLSAGSFPTCPQQLAWDWATAGSQELKIGLPRGWQKPDCLSHHCCLPGRALARSWEQERELGVYSRHSDVACGPLCWQLNSKHLS